jgi:hypothetical protein
MSCCGQKRQAVRAAPRPATTTAAATTMTTMTTPAVRDGAPLAQQTLIPIESTGAAPITVRGATTGIIYRFVARGRVLGVDARDAAGLLATAYFKRR